MDFSIKLSQNKILRGFINSPGEHVRAGVILVHGIGEHTGRYSHWIKKFSENGIACAGVDLPGHGKSDGKRGHIRNYRVTGEMLDIMIAQYRKTFPGIPVFLYGQSLGGGIVLKYIIESNPPVKGAIITSPLLKLAFEPPASKIFLSGLMKSIIPSLIQPSGLNPDHLCHDKQVVEEFKNDPLVHDRISVGLYHSAVSAAEFILTNTNNLLKPVLIMQGSDDRIASPEGSRQFVSGTSRAELKIWENGYHELHNEPFSDDVFSEILKWINKII